MASNVMKVPLNTVPYSMHKSILYYLTIRKKKKFDSVILIDCSALILQVSCTGPQPPNCFIKAKMKKTQLTNGNIQ